MEEVIIAGALKFNEQNCPTRKGELINTIEEIADIENPVEGMIVFVRDEKRAYRVISLKEKTIAGIVVPNAQVDEFVMVLNKEDIELIEDSIKTLKNDLVSTNTAIEQEVTRAKEAETALNANIVNTAVNLSSEVARAENAEAELLNRLQGKSDNSSALTDPFKYVPLYTMDDLDVFLNGSPTQGMYRCQIGTYLIEVVITTNAQLVSAFLTRVDSVWTITNSYNVYLRYRASSDAGFGDWQTVSGLEQNKAVISRLQGKSEDSNAQQDPFTYVGEYTSTTYTDFITWLDSLHSTTHTDNNRGKYRAVVVSKIVEVLSYPILYSSEWFVQVVSGCMGISGTTNNLAPTETYNSYLRSYKDGAWSDWTAVGGQAIATEIANTKQSITDLIGEAPETLDTIHEIAAWINNDESGAVAMATQIANNATAIEQETTRATEAEQEITTSIASDIQITGVEASATKMTLTGTLRGLDESIELLDLASATEKKAGVMTPAHIQSIANNATTIANEVIRAKEAETDAIAQGKALALRELYIAAGATYNESTGYYSLNGVTDITEAQMAFMYSEKELIYRLAYPRTAQGFTLLKGIFPIRSATPLQTQSIKIEGLCTFYNCNQLQVLRWDKQNTDLDTVKPDKMPKCTYLYSTFELCKKLETVWPINVTGHTVATANTFRQCYALTELRLYGVGKSLVLSDSSLLSKASILYLINNSAPTEAITFTLHADAYARVADDADVLAALEAHPLVLLVNSGVTYSDGDVAIESYASVEDDDLTLEAGYVEDDNLTI